MLTFFPPSPPLRGRGIGGEGVFVGRLTPLTPNPSFPEAGGEGRRVAVAMALALLLLAPGLANAALDPELEKPYELTIVLDVGKHRILTEVFRQQIRRELRDGLQAAFGDAVRVVVSLLPGVSE